MARWIMVNRCEKCKTNLEGWHMINSGDIERSLCNKCFNEEANSETQTTEQSS